MSGYREDEDALRSKVSELEGELASAKAEIGRLRGETTPAAATPVAESRILGTPKHHAREATLPFTLTDDGYAAVARILRSRLGLSSAQVGGDLTAPGFTLLREAGSTRIRITTDFSARAAGVVATAGLSLVLPGLPILGVLADVATHGGPHWLPFHALWILPSVALGVGALVRSRTRTVIGADIAKIDGAFEAILDAAKEHAKAAPAVRARVAEPGADEADAPADEATGQRRTRA